MFLSALGGLISSHRHIASLVNGGAPPLHRPDKNKAATGGRVDYVAALFGVRGSLLAREINPVVPRDP